ncbi:glycoside hydrolase family 95-like protein [uncultured Sunxiuqinia sp.]|uniref:glycosyl hydrolase family 95 catalytic domain-containing protein n=1 Tax=uncultured Sunxiuqinia sp. TaxID=1573825 RepID=UPI002606A7D3|nr:glycoside hydrolase N-terminal domain-containing protein [uncultured Sunxiuqinia sp.]
MNKITVLCIALLLFSCTKRSIKENSKKDKLVFTELATVWDEAMPLGNGMVGNLIWQKNGKLRFSLDRADLWDLRPMESIDFDKWKFRDVYEYWKADNYLKIQETFDHPYGKLPAPSKIPAGALEFEIEALGKVKEVSLDIETATCMVEWECGAQLTTFVHAEKPVGWYKFENLPEAVTVSLISPAYNRENEETGITQSKNALNTLGYEQGEIIETKNSLTYSQKGWDDFAYQISTRWEAGNNSLSGCWSVSSEKKDWELTPKAIDVVQDEIKTGYQKSMSSHLTWWSNYWAQSSITIPDSILQKQYYMEMYKFGSAARADAPPISLQAVWTADHGKLPPWKGDFHHDLNTQLSYWPSYAGNYLNLEEGFINWLWKYRDNFKQYTKDYFEVEGLNVPGVSTLEGKAMGGWIQYALGQGASAWLAHHFYLHWQFSQDREFLEKKAYPWLKDVAVFLDEISVIGPDGKRKLKISSSPEIYNNSREAWFAETTNFDLALIRWNLEKTAELATELGLNNEAEKWTKKLEEWPELAIHSETGFMFAPGFPYNESHRHFSHLLAFHPLGIVDFSKGESDKIIIENTLKNLEANGSSRWTGYSFSWQGNLYARAFDGEKAVEVLKTFAKCYCLKNSFHVNRNQCKDGQTGTTYRPFTLEGNFAFASAIQEMLIQSHTGVVKVFPAIPASWKDVAFENLRTYGAFLVTAEMKNRRVNKIVVSSERGGKFILENPFGSGDFICSKKVESKDNLIVVDLMKDEVITLNAN